MPESGIDQLSAPAPKIEKITTADIKPVIPEVGGTVIVLQRNASDKASRSLPETDPNFGALGEGEAEATRDEAKAFFDGILNGLSPEEQAKVDILVVAGNATLRMPQKKGPRKRSIETAEHVLEGARASLTEHGLDVSQLLNKTGKPIELTSGRLLDLKMLDESEFLKFLLDKYGDTQQLWARYEDDTDKEVRLQMGVEGPWDVADRVAGYMETVKNALRHYHDRHPDRRAIVYAVSQYDSISPFVKKYAVGQTIEDWLQVGYRAGVVFDVKKDGQTSTQIQGQNFPVSFNRA